MSKVETMIKELLEEKASSSFEYSRELNLVTDLGLDSIQLLDITMELEDNLDIVFEDEDLDLEIISNLDALIKLVEEKMV